MLVWLIVVGAYYGMLRVCHGFEFEKIYFDPCENILKNVSANMLSFEHLSLLNLTVNVNSNGMDYNLVSVDCVKWLPSAKRLYYVMKQETQESSMITHENAVLMYDWNQTNKQILIKSFSLSPFDFYGGKYFNAHTQYIQFCLSFCFVLFVKMFTKNGFNQI